ncbi:MAG: nucleotidyltransferase domain-containing protein [Prevotellaceae bacterium]|nr:nucleotidyltransferase domain-containing protein [Prevotellaceae bacterium]
MLNLNDCCRKLADFKNAHSQEYGIKKIGIFGSVARQENTEDSDIDIVVHIDNPTLAGMYNLHEALVECFGCDVDVIRMRNSLRDLMKRNIERDTIYV